jgi:hypothetical protein
VTGTEEKPKNKVFINRPPSLSLALLYHDFDELQQKILRGKEVVKPV